MMRELLATTSARVTAALLIAVAVFHLAGGDITVRFPDVSTRLSAILSGHSTGRPIAPK